MVSEPVYGDQQVMHVVYVFMCTASKVYKGMQRYTGLCHRYAWSTYVHT